MASLNLTFAKLFRKFRLRSGIATLSEFADALAQEGFVYEESLFSHWQKGDRVPKDRGFLISILSIFVKRGGISRVDEANLFLASIGQRDLSAQELSLFSKNLSDKTLFTAPDEYKYFIGREKYLKEVTWHLLTNKPVLIYGEAGAGKTQLGIKIAHTLREKFSGGVFWQRFDIKGSENIFNNIARVFGEDISRIKDKKIKSEIFRELLAEKNSFLILDNVESFEDIHLFLPTAKQQYSLLLTSKYLYKTGYQIKQIKLNKFNKRELLELAERILGLPFVLTNSEKIKQLGRLLNFSPLAATVLFRIIEKAPRQLNTFLHHFEKKITEVYKVSYDNKSLYDSLNLSFNALSNTEQNVFISLGVFPGADFSKDAVDYINKINQKESARKLLNLQRTSLLERSAYGRYRLHPLIKQFAQSKIKNLALFDKLASYYKEFLSQFERRTYASYALIEKELDNIIGIFEKCYHLGFYKRIVELWEFIGVFLWDRGRWKDMRSYERLVVNACKKTNDNRMLALSYIREFSWLYFWQGDIKKASEFGQRGLSIAANLKDNFIIAQAKQRLGMVYQKQNKLKSAQLYLNEALKIFKKLDKKTFVGDTLLYLGHVLKKKRRLEEAETCYIKSYLRLKMNKDHEGSSIALYYLGEINLQRKRLSKAKKFFSKALLIDRLKNRRAGVAWCLFGLGEVNLLSENVSEARQMLQQSRKIFSHLGIDDQVKLIDKRLFSL